MEIAKAYNIDGTTYRGVLHVYATSENLARWETDWQHQRSCADARWRKTRGEYLERTSRQQTSGREGSVASAAYHAHARETMGEWRGEADENLCRLLETGNNLYTASQRKILSHLIGTTIRNHKGMVYISQENLAATLGMCRATVTRAFARFEADGVFQRVRSGGRRVGKDGVVSLVTNAYKLIYSRLRQLLGQLRESTLDFIEKRRENVDGIRRMMLPEVRWNRAGFTRHSMFSAGIFRRAQLRLDLGCSTIPTAKNKDKDLKRQNSLEEKIYELKQQSISHFKWLLSVLEPEEKKAIKKELSRCDSDSELTSEIDRKFVEYMGRQFSQ